MAPATWAGLLLRRELGLGDRVGAAGAGRSRAHVEHSAGWQTDCIAASLRQLQYMATDEVRPCACTPGNTFYVSG